MTTPAPGAGSSTPGLGGWAPDLTGAGAEWAAAPADLQAAACQIGVHTVWALSGRQYGLAELTVAPWVPYAAPYFYRSRGYPWMSPFLISKWDRSKRLYLDGPIVEVREVIVSGVTMAAEVDYHLDPDGHLVRLGSAIWPVQDLTRPIFTARYVRGVVVPPAANLAAGAYAEEWLKGHLGVAGCRLPKRTQTIARQGVTISLADPEKLAAARLTGLPEVDQFISAANPGKLEQPPTVWSPETVSHRILSVASA